ncbi:MAG: MBL fold metallo-hydrolase [Marivibrio sp.]|uniref:MBL fold metallo-hydrolase n=1 Tax=Marivibrio sp. TaxID=2039719 RepID=UPI0032EBDC4D
MATIPIIDPATGARWYRMERLASGVRLIWEHHVSPDVHCNIWLVEGRDRNLLFDSGMGLRPMKAELAVLCEKPVVCVSSHSHFDHMGGAGEFDEHVGHAAEAEVFAAPNQANTLAKDFIAAHHFSSLPYEGFTCARYQIAPAPLTRTVDEGDVVDLGDRRLEVLHLPGHSPGSIGLWEAESGLLFTGDCVYDGELLDDLHHSDRAEFHDSMARLSRWPADAVHAGHYDSFGRARLRTLAEDYMAGRRRPGCPAERS